MVPPKPQTKTNEILARLDQLTTKLQLLEEWEYYRLKREADEIVRVNATEGLYLRAVLSAMYGNLSQFIADVRQIKASQQPEFIKPLFYGHFAALGDIASGRELLKEINLASPEKIPEKFQAFEHDFQIDKMRYYFDFAERLGIQEELGMQMPTIDKKESLLNYMAQKGIRQAQLDEVRNLAAKASLKHGVILLKSPDIYYDGEEDLFFLFYSLPVNIEKSFDIQDSFQEMVDESPIYPRGAFAFAIYAEGDEHALHS